MRAEIIEAHKPKLLLVDDDETLLRLMSIRLQGEGFDVTSVNNATHALRRHTITLTMWF